MAGAKPIEPRGTVATGRITKLAIGQGHGFIRLNSGREVFFHRADVHEGVSFNRLNVGDRVTFELFEDVVSGARAVRVKPLRRP
jgi:cold shock CspA family protein